MAAETLEELETAEETTPPEENAPAEQSGKPEQQTHGEPNPPKARRSILLPLLTLVLLVLGISEAVFWGYYGFSSYRHSLALERREEQLKAIQAELAARGIVSGSAYGPYRRIENGTVTWQREEDLPAGDGLSGDGIAPGTGGEKRLSSLSVPWIPYALAETDTDDSQTAQNQPAGTAGDEPAPVNT